MGISKRLNMMYENWKQEKMLAASYDDMVECYKCKGLFFHWEVVSYPKPNGPDDFDLELVCNQCEEGLVHSNE